MAYNTKEFEVRIKEIEGWLTKEFSTIRTGSATPALLDSIQVDSYGARVPLQQVGSVGIEDARTLRIQPWSHDAITDVEKAIRDANLGISVVVDDKGLRVIFPDLTSERRTQLLKIAKAKLEEARVSLRKSRDEVMKDIDTLEKKGEMSENERFNMKEQLQKFVDTANGAYDEIYKKKETEINQ